jgi:hypothetical protein
MPSPALSTTVKLTQSLRKFLRPESEVLLGRWRIVYKESTIAKTIDQANEDHCGTCVETPKTSQSHQTSKTPKKGLIH